MSEILQEIIEESGDFEAPNFGYSEDELKHHVAMGTIRAESFARRVVLKKKIGRKKRVIDEAFVKEVNAKHAFYYPGVAGTYRIDDETRISGHQPTKAVHLPSVMYKFGHWLSQGVEKVGEGSGEIIPALETAAGAYYALVFEHSPFDVANKRTARTVINATLMRACEEVHVGITIPPITVDEKYFTLAELGKQYEMYGKLRMDPFMKGVLAAQETGQITALELHFANIWLRNLQRRRDQLSQLKLKPGKNAADDLVWNATNKRIGILEGYVEQQQGPKQVKKLVPDILHTSLYTVVA